MSHGFFATVFFIPLYNALILLIGLLPGRSVGVAIILLTIIIRLILFPLSKKAIKTQLQMKQIEPEVQAIRDKVKDRSEQGRQILSLYKTKDVNPFAGFFLILIQLPILIALYNVFQSGLPKVDLSVMYSFIHVPVSMSMSFLGGDLISSKTLKIIIAIIAVITQFIQINLSLPKVKKKENGTFQHDLAYSMNMQMRYIFPIIMFFIAYVSSVIGLYLVTTNIFMTIQEIVVKRKLISLHQIPTEKKV